MSNEESKGMEADNAEKEVRMKRITVIFLAIVVCLGIFQISRSVAYALAADCWGGYECGNPGDQGAKCGRDKDLCQCKVVPFVGTACKEN